MPGKKNHPPRLNLTQLNALTRKAEQGDRRAMLRLRQILADNGDRLKGLVGDRCRHAQGVSVKVASADQIVPALAIRAHLDRLRERLASEGSSPAETLLIERVTHCWLALYTLEQEAAGRSEPCLALDQSIDRVHRRFIQAISELARLRRRRERSVRIKARSNNEPARSDRTGRS